MQGCRQALQVLRANLGSSEIGCVFYWEIKFSSEFESGKWQDGLCVEHHLVPFKKVMRIVHNPAQCPGLCIVLQIRSYQYYSVLWFKYWKCSFSYAIPPHDTSYNPFLFFFPCTQHITSAILSLAKLNGFFFLLLFFLIEVLST